METTTRAHRAGLVALAASLWGTSALLREPLLGMGLPASTIVLLEHVVLHDLRHESHAGLELPTGAPTSRLG